MAEKSTLAPQKAGKQASSSLQMIGEMALRRMGDFSSGSVSGEVFNMFVELGNRIVEDIRIHPYWDGGDIDYYVSLEERRGIPDMILLDGVVAHYALQQGSKKAEMFTKLYYRNLNQILYERKFGNLPLEIITMDLVPLPTGVTSEGIVTETI